MHIYIYIFIYIYIGIQSLNLKLQLPPTEISFLNLESYFINNSSMHCDVNRKKKKKTTNNPQPVQLLLPRYHPRCLKIRFTICAPTLCWT